MRPIESSGRAAGDLSTREATGRGGRRPLPLPCFKGPTACADKTAVKRQQLSSSIKDSVPRSPRGQREIIFSSEVSLLLFEYDSTTVSSAGKVISVSICYSQRDGFNASLSRSCTVPTSTCLTYLPYLLWCSGRWHGHVLPRMTVIEIM